MGLDTQAGGLAALSGVFLFLTTTTVVLRFVARFRQKSGIGLDDYAIVVAWVGFVGLAALSFYGISHKFIGYGAPKDPVAVKANIDRLLRTYLAIDSISAVPFGMSKISALFFFRRIFCNGVRRGPFHYVTEIFLVLSLVWTISFIAFPLNFCGPGKSLDYEVTHLATCHQYEYFQSVAVSDFILDVIIMILPIPKIWILKTSTTQKVAITSIFLMALVGLSASTARLVIMLNIVNTGSTSSAKKVYDEDAQILYYAILESGFTIVAVNGPSLWYFVGGSMALERVVRSVRSIISLSSRRDSNANGSTSEHISRDTALKNSWEAEQFSGDNSKGSVDSYAMADLDSVPAAERGERGIRVDREFNRQVETSQYDLSR